MLLGFMLVLTRISSFLLVLPVFGSKILPIQLKAAAAVLLSLFFCTTVPLGVDPARISTLGAMVLLASEAVYGLALGLIAAVLFSVVTVAAMLVVRRLPATFPIVPIIVVLALVLSSTTGLGGPDVGAVSVEGTRVRLPASS
jgi:hypothetical protein